MTEEDFHRLEYKVDLILEALRASNMLLSVNDLREAGVSFEQTIDCPACGQTPKFLVNVIRKGIDRVCGCNPPVRYIDIPEPTPPPASSKNESPTPTSQGGTTDVDYP